MPPDRLRSIVPMFGGDTRYVQTLDAILDYVDTQHPTTDDLVGWHRGRFDRVSSRDSIVRRLRYLESVGFIKRDEGVWTVGRAGERYLSDQTTETLLDIMCRRNVGLRSLLYALSAGGLTIEEISHQQLDTHPELGWDPANTDMARQRVNWLRSLDVVQKEDDRYELTADGRQFTDEAVEAWADSSVDISEPSATADLLHAGTYETTVETRSVDPEFRATTLSRFDRTCPVSGVDHPALLDVAHVLSWSDYPDYRGDLRNVLPLSKTHHAAFDRGFFTIDEEYRIRVNPAFETESRLLQETIFEQAGQKLSISADLVKSEYLRKHNGSLGWV
jgi:putative restriction endonuclease